MYMTLAGIEQDLSIHRMPSAEAAKNKKCGKIGRANPVDWFGLEWTSGSYARSFYPSPAHPGQLNRGKSKSIAQ